MVSWGVLPALRMALVLAAGIAVSALLSFEVTLIVIATSALMAAAALFWPVALQARTPIKGWGTLMIVFSAGLLAGMLSNPRVQQPSALGDTDYWVAEVESATQRGAWIRADAKLKRLASGAVWRDTSARVRLMLDSSFSESEIGAGTLLLSQARLSVPRGPLNPHTFDYAAYLGGQGIGIQSFVHGEESQVLRPPQPQSLVARMRSWIGGRINQGFPTSREAGVAGALLLGDKSGIDEQTRLNYTRTGAVHVLAVSGLHTGIIAYMLTFLMARLHLNGPRGRILQLLLLWAGLAGYVALTGYSPSVQRSAVMFGILFAGRTLRLEANALNSLGLSAVLLLLIDPQLLFTLGFQLSYLAVAGILVFQPPLRRWLATGYKVPNYFIDLLTVGFAATLATAPLTTYYFHQFPLYFLLSGIPAIIFVTLALGLSMVGLCADVMLSLVGVDASWLYLPGYFAVYACNYSLELIATLPGALVESLWPSLRTTALSLLGLACWGAFAKRGQPRLALAGALGLLLSGASILWDSLERRSSNEVITYAIRGAVITDVIAGGTVVQLSPKPALLDKMRREVYPHRAALNLRQAEAVSDYRAYPNATHSAAATPEPSEAQTFAYAVGDERWLVLPEASLPLAAGAPAVDWVLVRDVRGTKPEELAATFPDATFVLNDYIPSWQQEDWLPYAHRTHVLPNAGAYYALRD